jgi:hypothetical protein
MKTNDEDIRNTVRQEVQRILKEGHGGSDVATYRKIDKEIQDLLEELYDSENFEALRNLLHQGETSFSGTIPDMFRYEIVLRPA